MKTEPVDLESPQSRFNLSAPGSHADHMLRQTRTQLMQLSQMADAKAGMLITISSIVTSLTVPLLLRPEFHIAAAILITTSVLTILLAAYATMPKIFAEKNKRPNLSSPNFNILFFTDFVKLDYNDFHTEIERIVADPGLAYSTQTKEVYLMGQYLANRKFKFLTLSYVSFISGLILSVGFAFYTTSLSNLF